MSRTFLTSLLLVAACGDSGGRSDAFELPAGDQAFCAALGADYKNNVGALSIIGLPSMTVIKNYLPGTVSGDPVMRVIDGRLYIINRSKANVTIVDPGTAAVEAQFSTGAGSNPQDIALGPSHKAYIPLYDKGEVQVWDLTHPAAATAPAKSISIASYDLDGNPNANSIAVVGGRAYVTLDLLDTEMYPSPRGKGKVVVIDTATDEILTALELKYENPYDFMYVRGDKLVVATFDDFSGQKGCLEQIVTTGEPKVIDCLLENKTVNGVVNSFAVSPDTTFLAVSRFDLDFNQEAEIRRLDAAGNLVAGAMTPPGQIPTDVAYSPSGHLVYSDAHLTNYGVRVYDLAGGTEVTIEPINIGLKPAAANAIVCMSR